MNIGRPGVSWATGCGKFRLTTAAMFALIVSLIASDAANASDAVPSAPASQPTPLPPPVVLKTQTGVEVEVAFSGSSDIQINKSHTDASENALFALMSVPAGLVMAIANPGYIAAPIIGIASVPAGQAFKQQAETVAAVLDPASFAAEIARAMAERLEAVPDIGAGARYAFRIDSYGLAARDALPKVFDAGRDVCLFVQGTLRITSAGDKIDERNFALTRSGRTQGLPPPACQPFDQFGSYGGESLRAAVTETAYVIGAWSAQARAPQ